MPASVLDLDAEGNVDRAEALMIAKWPEPADYAKYVDEDAERAFELCRTVVSAARATRSRYRLSPKAELDVVVRAGAEDIEELLGLGLAAFGPEAAADAAGHDDAIGMFVHDELSLRFVFE